MRRGPATVWNDWRVIRSLAARSRAASSPSSLTAISGRAASSRRTSAGEQGDRRRVLERLDRRRARLAAPHRQLAEDVAAPQLGERDRAPVAVVARHARRAAAHDVAGVAVVTLAEDDLAGRPAARDRDVGELRDVARPEPREEGHLGQQFDGVGALRQSAKPKPARAPVRGVARTRRRARRASAVSATGSSTPSARIRKLRMSSSDPTASSTASSVSPVDARAGVLGRPARRGRSRTRSARACRGAARAGW